MKIKDGFKLRSVLGQKVIVGEGATQINFNKLISLNPTAALLWESAEGRDFTNEDLADLLLSKFDIDRATALADVASITSQWIDLGLVTA